VKYILVARFTIRNR